MRRYKMTRKRITEDKKITLLIKMIFVMLVLMAGLAIYQMFFHDKSVKEIEVEQCDQPEVYRHEEKGLTFEVKL